MIRGILACDAHGGIGKDNKLPWPTLREDMMYFKSMTENNVVIMGYNTWKSLGCKKLPNRNNIVLTSKETLEGDFDYKFDDIDDAIELANAIGDRIFVIGGAALMVDCIKNNMIDTLHINKIDATYDCDTFIDLKFIEDYFCIQNKNLIREHFPRITAETYIRRRAN